MEYRNKINLLLIEDNPGDAALIRAMLTESVSERYSLEHVAALTPGLKRLASGGIDVILLDLHLPDSHGIETYKKICSQAGEIPVVALTGHQDEQTAFDLFRNGIQDYLVKGETDSRMLILSLRNAIDRSRARIQLQLSEARFRRLIETTTDTVLIVDKEGLVRYINPAGALLFKTTPEEFLGQSFGFPVVEDETAEIELFAWQENPKIAEMRVTETEWEGKRAWLAAIRDITDRKKLESTLKKISKELKESIVQLETANKKILGDQQTLLEEERLKVLLQMAGSTAHELNQPLTVLLGNIGMVESLRDDPEEFRECMEDIENAGRRIGEIVKKVQNIRKYETKAYLDDLSIIKLDQTIKILSVEDSDDDFETIGKALAGNSLIDLVRARDIESALKRMEQTVFDIILLDHILPDGNGFTFSETLNQNDVDIPVIIVTGQADEIVASRLIMEGAYDYIPKTLVSKDVLNRSIKNTMEKVRLKREISHMNHRIHEMAIEDKLTGLYNRRHFQDMLENEMARGRRYRHKLVLAMMDLDHFKQINDTYGHLAGDRVLTAVGKIIRESFRENDVTCRYGGEEFAVLMPNLGLEKAKRVCDRLRKKVADHPFNHEGSDFHISISIGIAEYSIQGDQLPKVFIKRADEALCQAKKQGRIYDTDQGINKCKGRRSNTI